MKEWREQGQNEGSAWAGLAATVKVAKGITVELSDASTLGRNDEALVIFS